VYRALRGTACALAVVMLFAASAEAIELQPGLWELTSKIDRNGTVSTRSPHSRCITAEAAKAARTKTDFDISAGNKVRLSGRFGQDACKIVDRKNSRALMSWRLQCTGSPRVEQEGTARFDSPRHYVLVIRTSITAQDKTFTSVLTTEAQYKGECQR